MAMPAMTGIKPPTHKLRIEGLSKTNPLPAVELESIPFSDNIILRIGESSITIHGRTFLKAVATLITDK